MLSLESMRLLILLLDIFVDLYELGQHWIILVVYVPTAKLNNETLARMTS